MPRPPATMHRAAARNAQRATLAASTLDKAAAAVSAPRPAVNPTMGRRQTKLAPSQQGRRHPTAIACRGPRRTTGNETALRPVLQRGESFAAGLPADHPDRSNHRETRAVEGLVGLDRESHCRVASPPRGRNARHETTTDAATASEKGPRLAKQQQWRSPTAPATRSRRDYPSTRRHETARLDATGDHSPFRSTATTADGGTMTTTGITTIPSDHPRRHLPFRLTAATAQGWTDTTKAAPLPIPPPGTPVRASRGLGRRRR